MEANDANVVTAMADRLRPVRRCLTQASMSVRDWRTVVKKCAPAAVNSTRVAHKQGGADFRLQALNMAADGRGGE
jgi:hypothetical protein